MADSGVSTIFVAGIPIDATPRELENMVRFLPDYEAMKVTGPKGGGKGGAAIFVKFHSPAAANEAQKVLNNQPFDTALPNDVMRAEIARSDMKSTSGTAAAWPVPQVAYQAPPPSMPAYAPASYGPASYPVDGGSRKRPRTGEAPGGIDTIAVFGATEKGLSEQQVEDFFAQIPGFMAFKANRRVGGGFAKFASPGLAMEAIEVAANSGIEAQMAKSSMNSLNGAQANLAEEPAYDRYAQEPSPQYERERYEAPERQRYESSSPRGGGGGGGGVDTLILQGVTEKGWTTDSLRDFFSSVKGFIAFKANPRVGGGFVKFESNHLACEAMTVAANNGIDAQMARNSMNA